MSKHVSEQVGIYNTWARLTEHRNGDVTLHKPIVKWVGSSSALAFIKHRLTGSDATLAKEVFTGKAWIKDTDGSIRCLSYGEWVSRFNQCAYGILQTTFPRGYPPRTYR